MVLFFSVWPRALRPASPRPDPGDGAGGHRPRVGRRSAAARLVRHVDRQLRRHVPAARRRDGAGGGRGAPREPSRPPPASGGHPEPTARCPHDGRALRDHLDRAGCSSPRPRQAAHGWPLRTPPPGGPGRRGTSAASSRSLICSSRSICVTAGTTTWPPRDGAPIRRGLRRRVARQHLRQLPVRPCVVRRIVALAAVDRARARRRPPASRGPSGPSSWSSSSTAPSSSPCTPPAEWPAW